MPSDRKKWYLDTLALIRDRFHTLKDFTSLGRAYFADDFMIDAKPLEKNVLKFPELRAWLPELADRYENLAEFTLEETERVVRELAEELSIKARNSHQCDADRGHRPTRRPVDV